MNRKLLVIQAAALGMKLLERHGSDRLAGLSFRPAQTVFPAVTCTVQASFRTAARPSAHGMIANGLYFPRLAKVMFWEQSAGLVQGERFWNDLRSSGRKVGMLFWQQSLGESVDLVLSPAPIHKHHGGMIQDCYSLPRDLYPRLCETIGSTFKLRRYWGPMASAKVGDWIARATATVAAADDGPELLLSYLPTLDYDLQRHGPDAPRASNALEALECQLGTVLDAARKTGREVLVYGDYAIERTAGPAVYPNVALARAGLLTRREVGNRLYADLYTSRAFAMVDHEIAHIFVRNVGEVEAARKVLEELPGVEEVLGGEELAARGLDHPNSGQLVAVARSGTWFAYPWWVDATEAPDYARHVDIHNKPGFDPCELRFGWPPLSTSQDTTRIRGSHGRAGDGRKIAWAATFEPPDGVANVVDLALAAKQYLE